MFLQKQILFTGLMILSLSIPCEVLAESVPGPSQQKSEEEEKVSIAIINRDREWLNLEAGASLEGTFTIDTPVGRSPIIRKLRYKGVPFYYLTRFGDPGTGQIASLAEESYPGERTVQIWVTLKQLGVENVIHGNIVGGVNAELNYDDLMIVDDFIDFKPNHPQSVLPYIYPDESFTLRKLSTRMNPVLCPELRRALYDQALTHHHARVFYGGTLVQTRTGRWETPAEIRMIEMLGGDMVCTQDGTYIVYARQARIHFATLQFAMNFGEGLRPMDTRTTSPAGFQRIADSMRNILLETVVTLKDFKHNCGCFPPQEEYY